MDGQTLFEAVQTATFYQIALFVFRVVPVVGIASLLFWALNRNRMRMRRADEANRLVTQALSSSGKPAGILLAEACRLCQRQLKSTPEDDYTLHVWGTALWGQACRASNAEAAGLYVGAEEKFRSAFAINPNLPKLANSLLYLLADQARLRPGDAGRLFLRQICEICERMVSDDVQAVFALHMWGCALAALSARTPKAEADGFSELAKQKVSMALSISPDDTKIVCSLGFVILRSADLCPGADSTLLIDRAYDLFENVLLRDPADYLGLSGQAHVLFCRAKRLPGEATKCMVDETLRRFECVASTKKPTATLLEGVGCAAMGQR